MYLYAVHAELWQRKSVFHYFIATSRKARKHASKDNNTSCPVMTSFPMLFVCANIQVIGTTSSLILLLLRQEK